MLSIVFHSQTISRVAVMLRSLYRFFSLRTLGSRVIGKQSNLNCSYLMPKPCVCVLTFAPYKQYFPLCCWKFFLYSWLEYYSIALISSGPSVTHFICKVSHRLNVKQSPNHTFYAFFPYTYICKFDSILNIFYLVPVYF